MSTPLSRAVDHATVTAFVYGHSPAIQSLNAIVGEIARTNIPPDYVALMTEASTTARTVVDISQAVHHGLANPGLLATTRTIVSEELFYKPGTATARAAQELYELMELSPATT